MEERPPAPVNPLVDDFDADPVLAGAKLASEVAASREALKRLADGDGPRRQIGTDVGRSHDGARSQLGTVAAGLTAQPASITEEMNKLRQELYGDQGSGIGGIAKDLEKLKAGNLGLFGQGGSDSLDFGDALGNLDLSEALGNLDGAFGERLEASGRGAGLRAGLGGGDGRRQRLEQLRSDGAPPTRQMRELLGDGARRRGGRCAEDEDEDVSLEEMRRLMSEDLPCARLGRSKRRRPSSSQTAFWEGVGMLLLLLVLICVVAGVASSTAGKDSDEGGDFYF